LEAAQQPLRREEVQAYMRAGRRLLRALQAPSPPAGP
jgi:hypothetical protein